MSAKSDRILVGVTFPKINPEPSAIRRKLACFADEGYDCVEVSLDMVPLIIGGEIRMEYVDFLQSILKEFDFCYSAHIGSGLDNRDEKNLDLQKKTLFSSIEICDLMKLNILVLHYEAESKDLRLEDRFLELHIEAAEFASRHGIQLCMENIEVERIDPLIRFLKRADKSNLQMTFDTGHAYLASKFFHFDFLESLKQSLPFIGHVHLSDNTGAYEELRITNRLVYDTLAKQQRFTLGRGDIHLPPFWGKIPFDDVCHLLKDFRGIYLCEFYSDFFLPFNRTIQEKVRSAIEKARD